MVIHTMYKRKIKHYNHIFDDTVRLYRGAVDYLISVCMDRWTEIVAIPKELERKTYVESMIHKTKDNPVVPYAFDDLNASYNIGGTIFYKRSVKDCSGDGTAGHPGKSSRVFEEKYLHTV